ncbi:MAG: RHS repeat-associated core domain-containing protein [Terracidiphilus sp.]
MMIAFCAPQSNAQAAPGVYADATHPAGPPDPTKLDSIWQVDPLTGSLSVTIPFTTTPAGGRGPKIPFTLHYNSASTITLQSQGSYSVGIPGIMAITTTTALNNIVQQFRWSPTPIGPTTGPVGPWTTSGPFLYSAVTTIPNQEFTETVGNVNVQVTYGSGCTIYGPFIYTDESGAAHDMNLELTNAGSSNTNMAPPCSGTVSGDAFVPWGPTSATTDGSALATTWSQPIGDTTLNGFAPNILYPDGTQFYTGTAPGGTLEDSNGNQATFVESGNTWTATDSLGRAAFTTTIPVGYAGQIPPGTYNVTTAGESGNSESYSVVFSTVPLGSFTMPNPIGGTLATAGIRNLGYCLTSITCTTEFGIIQPTPGSTLPALTSITLPDSTQYLFTYDTIYGTISKIEFPTGGYVRFVWGIRGDTGGYGAYWYISTLVVTDVYTSTGSGSENHWHYNFPSYSTTSGLTSTVTAPDGSTTAYTGVPIFYTGPSLYQMAAAPSWKEASRLEYSSSGTLMKSVATTYVGGNGNGLPAQVATTLYDGPTPLQQYVQYAYDSSVSTTGYQISYANVVEKDESDFNPCSGTPCPMPTTAPSFLRKTFTSYAYANTALYPAWVTAHIVNKPFQVLVTDGSNNPYSLTTYSYDQNGYTKTPSAGIQHYDYTNFGSLSLPRGNLTTESKCISGISATITNGSFTASCGSSWNTSYYYDGTGQLTQKVEAAGTSQAATTTNTWGEQNNGFLTQVLHPDGNKDSYTYWQPIGAMASHTDWNGQSTGFVTNYDYTDPLNRIRSVTLPQTTDGTTGNAGRGTTTYNYNDSAGDFWVQEKHTVDTAGTTTSVTKYYDGLGRLATTVTAVPTTQCSTGNIQVQTTYDTMSRVSSTSNPYCSTSDPTYGITQFAYDALGRKIKTTLPDGSISTIAYAGNATETTDPPNGTTSVQHIQQSDGLGRLTNVCEVSASSLSSVSGDTPSACGLNIGGSGYLTSYAYDPLGNMRSVNQHGLTRTFTYDNLSRLLTAMNPEVGTDTYAYSSSSSACSPSADVPCARQDARGVITSYTYDSMSRLTSKSYSTAATNTTGAISDLTSCYQYNTPIAGYSDTNPKGQLTAEWQQAGSCPTTAQTTIPSGVGSIRIRSNHDAMGRVGLDSQCLTNSDCTSGKGNFVYTYNLLGNPVQSNNGDFAATVGALQVASTSGNGTPIAAPSITWKTTYDMADHIASVVFQDQPSTSIFPASTYSFAPAPLQPTNYDPFGHMTTASLGIPNGSSTAAVTIARQYDNRGRITNETDGGTVVASSASGSSGSITLSGAEAGPLTIAATPGTGVLTVTGSDGSNVVCTTITNQYTTYTTCNNVPDTGTLSVTVNGFTSTASYGSGTADSTIASQIASGFAASGSPVTATASGSSVTVTAKATGTASNYPITLSSGGGYVISDPSSTLSGGTNAVTVYDAGTATATISGGSPAVNYTTAAVSWGQGDTTATLASKLASAINSAAGSVVSASASGGTVNLLSKATGTGVDYSVSVSIADTQTSSYPTLFPSASFTAKAVNMTGGASVGFGPGTIYSYQVPSGGYAANGNILQHKDLVMGTWNFTYDAVDRLMTATPGGSNPTEYQGKYGCWTYDSFGNRTLEAFSTVACTGSNPTPQAKAVYNQANNRIQSISGTTSATFIYDASGNTLYDGNNYYWYDAEGQLCAVQKAIGGTITQYVYDGEGARIAKGTLASAPSLGATCPSPLGSGFAHTARWLVDQGGEQVTEFDNGNWAHSNIWAGGKLTATYDLKGIHYELADPLGTKRVQANAAGQVDETCTSLPFGNDVGNPIAANCTVVANSLSTGDDATEHHFTQKERDTESGNDYFYARYYSSTLGRFTTPDWSAKTDPVPYAVFADPQSLNLYAYVRNNPLTRVDADGHACKENDGLCQALAKAWDTIHQIGVATVGAAVGYAKGDFGPLPPKSLAEHKTVKAPGTPKWHWSQKTGSMDEKVDGMLVQHAGTGYSGQGTGLNNPLADDVGDKGKPNWGPTPAGDYQISPPSTEGHLGPVHMRLTPDDPNNVYGRGPFLIHAPEKGERIGIDPPVSSEGCQVLDGKARLAVAGSHITDEVVEQ